MRSVASPTDSIASPSSHAATAPLQNKLRPWLLRPSLRNVLGQRRPAISMREVFAERKILLVSLAQGQLGPEGAALLGALVARGEGAVVVGRMVAGEAGAIAVV